VIGGVIASTVLTLVVIPTVYEIFEEWRSAFLRRFGKSGAHAAPHGHGIPAPSTGD
jgi:HAE1 family hydrophobic/amphiphilic exporter-1